MGRFALVSLGWLILAVSLSGAGAQNSCPFHWYEYNGFCYEFFSELKTWNTAELFCTEQNADCHLASIHSKEETDAISNYLRLVGSAGHVWIGLWDPLHVGMWQWTDGSKVDYTNWAPGPMSGYCTYLGFESQHRNWYKGNCGSALSFLCKYPLGPQSGESIPSTLETEIAAPDCTPAPQ